MATVEPYRINWPSGEDKLLVISIGTTAPFSAISGASIFTLSDGSAVLP